MRRIVTLALLAVYALLPCSAQQSAPQAEKRRPGPFLIRGPVHSIRDERATLTVVNGEMVEGPRVPVLTITFNEDGTHQEQAFYQPDGNIRSKRIFLYDEDGRTLETTEINGKDEVLAKAVFHYDSQKKLIERIGYRPDGSIMNKQTYSRQGNQTISESTMYDRNGAVINQSTTTTTTDRQTTPGRQEERYETLSNNGGRVVRRTSVITRTPDGVQLSEERSDVGPPRRETFNTDKNNSTEQVLYNADGSIKSRARYEREFDSHGNLIKTVRSVAEGDSADFKPVDVTYRIIEYYK